MYKHDSEEYLPQHPMLVQIREEKELYNSLPESMKSFPPADCFWLTSGASCVAIKEIDTDGVGDD